MWRFGVVGLMRFVNAQNLPIEEVRAIYARAKDNMDAYGLFVETGSVSKTLKNPKLESDYIKATAQCDDPGYLLYQADLSDRRHRAIIDRRNAYHRT